MTVSSRSILNFLAISLALLLLLAACSSSETHSSSETETSAQSEREKTVTIMYSFPSSSLDPHQEWVTLRAGITETLVRLNEKLELEPWLATEWAQQDELTWVFTIREGVTFHDGTPLTAEEVKASLERGLEVNPSLQTTLKIDSLEADGQKLMIKTTEPYPALPSELVNPNTSIVKVDTTDLDRAPVGTGPFKVESFAPDVEIGLVRFDEYWAGPSPLEKAKFVINSDANVRALALQSHEADIVYHLPVESLEVIEQQEELTVQSVSSLRAHFLIFNHEQPHMQNEKVRQAIDLLIDRGTISHQVMQGHATPANGPFHPDFPFSAGETAPAFDPEQARALLEAAGWELDDTGQLVKEGKPLSLNLLTYQSRPELPLIAQLLQAEAAKIGMTINIQSVDNIDTYLHEHHDWDLATYSSLTAPRGDGGYFLNVAYTAEGALNAGGIEDTALSEIIAQLNQTSDPEQRHRLTQEAVQIIQDKTLHAFIIYPHIVVGINNRVLNWSPGAEEYYMLTHQLDVR
ncbi:peptide/nickel transport system substrate-binding protein [Caldalkalibacillus uzonensis]|uniref:Peptide/nickel transport system substrate-binding protein n=1 Tax=Caldalkalibacillus uzonensis TaxID=353224 RepID=A0ABU0CRK6_9BACI|nr:nickel ABC transporter substrate-binding protein [Caldalkalibacillus uzonensis]MDQ0339055.1 peptide/nickel transport system substrate-binding protein [Caldalkalibacillus uzonensis]